MQAREGGSRESFGANHGLPGAAAVRDRLAPIAVRIVERAKGAGVLRPGFSATDVPMLFVMVGGLSDYLGSIDPGLWRRYPDFFLEGVLAAGTAHRRIPVQPPAASLVEAAMESWHRPRSRT